MRGFDSSLLRRVVLLSVMTLFVASCAAAESDETTTTTAASETTTTTTEPAEVTSTTEAAATTSTSAPATTAAPQATLPESNVTASLGVGEGNTYKVEMATFAPLPFEDSDLPVPPGSVEIRWYTSGDRYVVAYVGIDLSQTGPLCPGNSILSTAGFFEDVSNAPTEEGACEGFPTLTNDPNVGPRECGNALVYVTAISTTKQGTLYGTLEALADDGTAVIGLTSQAATADGIPELDVEAVCG